MKRYILILFTLIGTKVFAQIPEDAIRYSWYPQSGTARNMAIGGAMGSLGGDITAAYVNPAGLGFYKTNEFVFTPGFFSNSNKANFRETTTKENRGAFNLGATGLILGSVSNRKPKNSSSFTIAINQVANFRNLIHYSGYNNYSSFSEQFAEEFAKSSFSIDEVLNTKSALPYTSAVALYTYLIDTVTINGKQYIKAAPESILDSGMALKQDMYKRTGGGVYDFSIAYAKNIEDKFYWGATLGIPYINYKSNTTFTEKDTSSNNFNNFKSFSYNDDFTTSGVGFNLKLGVIYKPTEFIRVGLAIHTPTFMYLTDTRTTTLTTNLEDTLGHPQSYAVDSRTFTNNQPGESKYSQRSPWKAILSASYVFREIENVKKQKGFITADIEYVNHKGSRFSYDNSEDITPEEESSYKAYYKALNNVVKDQFKGAFNFRVGGELKFNVIMARLGFAYYGNPYKDGPVKAHQVLLSGGLGYRNKGFFVDLTYVHKVNKDVNFPYRLEDRANTYAALDKKSGNLVATVGFKF